jgi:hypothetical protein
MPHTSQKLPSGSTEAVSDHLTTDWQVFAAPLIKMPSASAAFDEGDMDVRAIKRPLF